MRLVNNNMFYGNIAVSNTGVTGTGGVGGSSAELHVDHIMDLNELNDIFMRDNDGNLVLAVTSGHKVSVVVGGAETGYIDINGVSDATYSE